jgi:outer membrane protein assembly factor BamE
LGKPVLEDAFDENTWYYLYQMKRGMKIRGEDFRKELIVSFVEGKITQVTGDFELSEDFAIPLDQL